MDTELLSLFDFIKYSGRLREVIRNNNATADRKESVAEHSWHLALMCWILKDSFEKEFNTELSLDRMFKMCLMHDLVEIAAGDASTWKPEERVNKAEKEEAAALATFGTLPDSLRQEMLDRWHEFEEGETLESKVARGVDRINPAIMRLTTGQGWADVNGDVAHLDHIQLARVDFSSILLELYNSVKAEALEKALLRK